MVDKRANEAGEPTNIKKAKTEGYAMNFNKALDKEHENKSLKWVADACNDLVVCR